MKKKKSKSLGRVCYEQLSFKDVDRLIELEDDGENIGVIEKNEED